MVRLFISALFFSVFLIPGRLIAQPDVEQQIVLGNSNILSLGDDVSGPNDFDNPRFKYSWYFEEMNSRKPPMYTIHYSFGPGQGNDCIKFYRDSIANKNVLFSKVIGYLYKTDDIDDTLLLHKKLTKKCIMNYNSVGQLVFEEVLNANDKITDSTRLQYDGIHNLIRRVKYSDGDTGKMRKTCDEAYIWDDKGRIIKYMSLPSKQPSDTIIFSLVYDDANREVTETWKDEFGGILHAFYKDNNRQRIISFKFWGKGAATCDESYKYDSSGNMIEKLISNDRDTTWERYTYDKNNREIGEEERQSDSSSYLLATEYLPNGERVETSRSFSLYTGGCIRSRFEQKYTKVRTYDKDSNLISDITDGEENYKPYKITTTYRYRFSGDKEVYDSAITHSQREQHDSVTYHGIMYTYDSNGNRTEARGINDKDYRQTWKYNRANMLLQHRSCINQRIYTENFEYYNDNISLKQQKEYDDYGLCTAIVNFDTNSRIESFIFHNIDDEEYVFEYFK